MACKHCHKSTSGHEPPAKDTKRFQKKDGSPGVQTHVGAFDKSPHGMAVPHGHGESGASVQVTAGDSALRKAIDTYYTGRAAKRFVEAGD
jgi:hypothetical protein